MMGRLIYLSHKHPDITYAISLVSQFMHNPSEVHMETTLRVLKYLKSSPGRGILFKKNNHLNLIGYTDAD